MQRECPSEAELRAFHFGQLPVEALDALREHLESCPRCEASVQTFDQLTDPVIAALRGAPAAVGATRDLGAADSASVEEAPALDFLAPTRGGGELGWLAHFRVLKVLGQGGMGIVFLAEDTLLKRPVALKVLRPTLAQEASARQRFLREAQAAAGLQSDHIVVVHQVGEAGPTPYLAMEYLEGETLDHWRRRHGPPSAAELVRIATETAAGLAAAHARGLIHRDVKPGNIWLERRPGGDFRVKLLDFGLVLAAAGDARLTRQGTIVGTPAYMAPEMAEGRRVDDRCDLFSLGAVLYYLATGAAPFGGDNTVAALWAVSFKQPLPLGKARPDLPPALADLVMRLLAKDPDERSPSSAVVVETLRALAAGQSRPEATPRRRLLAPVLGLAGCVLGLVVIGQVLAPSGDVAAPTTTAAPPSAAVAMPNEEAWLTSVAGLTPKDQLDAVVARLKKLNPGFDGKLGNRVVATDAGVTELSLPTNHVTNLAPLRALTNLQYLECGSHIVGERSPLTDLTPLAKLPLRELRVTATSVVNLAPLRGVPLTRLDVAGTLVHDLTPLRDQPKLAQLTAGHTPISDLTPLRELPLTFLTIEKTRVADLGPLRQAPLQHLNCNETLVADLAPLTGKPLLYLKCYGSRVTSLEPLRGMKQLEVLSASIDRQRDAALLQGLTTLKAINDSPVADFWKQP